MIRIRNIIACALLVLIATIGLAACGGETPTATPAAATATPVPPTDTLAPPTATTASSSTSGQTGGMATGPAIDLLDQASKAMKDVKTMHVAMNVMSGTEQSLMGEGDVQPPDKVRLTMDMGTLGKNEIIMVGQDTYMKLSTTGSDSYSSICSCRER